MRNEFNEQHKHNREFALQVKKTYSDLIREWSWKATCGDKKAAIRFMTLLSERNIVLYHLGFRLGGRNRLLRLKSN